MSDWSERTMVGPLRNIPVRILRMNQKAAATASQGKLQLNWRQLQLTVIYWNARAAN